MEWQPIETAPKDGLILLAVEDETGERRTFAAEGSCDSEGLLVWQITAGWIGWQRLSNSWITIGWQHLPTSQSAKRYRGRNDGS